jgi:predicted transcriptional regulator
MKVQFTLRGFRRPRETVRHALGRLERKVLEELWRSGEVTVRELHDRFDRSAAYTTLMTTLDRLYRKGLLERRKERRAFVYTPRVSREEFDRVVAKELIDGLLGRNAEPVLACMVDAVSEHDRALFDELERLVREKRRKLASKGE